MSECVYTLEIQCLEAKFITPTSAQTNKEPHIMYQLIVFHLEIRLSMFDPLI